MTDKEHILSEIRRTAQENNDVPLGQGRFANETGIIVSNWRGRFWARWGDAIQEAGLKPNQKKERFDDDGVLEQLALEVRRLRRLPTRAELSLRRREDAGFPSLGVFERLGKKRILAQKLTDYCTARTEYDDVLMIARSFLASEDTPETEDCEQNLQQGFVYLLKSGRHYKLGRTNSFERRERELAIQLPERALTVHVIKTDDPSGIENYWHSRFADRRKNGEWFELTQADIKAFKRRKFM